MQTADHRGEVCPVKVMQRTQEPPRTVRLAVKEASVITGTMAPDTVETDTPE